MLLGVAAVLAILDWVALGCNFRRLEYVSKPGTTLALAGVAATLDPAHPDTRSLFVLALLASLVGDVFLMLPGDRLVPGIGSFGVAQALYTVGFALHGGSAAEYFVGALIVAALMVPLARRFTGAVRRAGRSALVAPIVCYLVLIGAMCASAIASGNVFAVVGALLFVVSDSLIAETRFVGPRPGARVAIMVTYYVAQALLVLSLLP